MVACKASSGSGSRRSCKVVTPSTKHPSRPVTGCVFPMWFGRRWRITNPKWAMCSCKPRRFVWKSGVRQICSRNFGRKRSCIFRLGRSKSGFVTRLDECVFLMRRVNSSIRRSRQIFRFKLSQWVFRVLTRFCAALSLEYSVLLDKSPHFYVVKCPYENRATHPGRTAARGD